MRRVLLAAALLVLAATAVQAEGLRPYQASGTPPLVLRGLDGRMYDLADYKGRVVLVHFWASWCVPCAKEIPALMALKTRLAGLPFSLLAVNVGESDAEAKEFLRWAGADFTVLMDRNGTAYKMWRVTAVPASFLVDGKGSVRLAAYGAQDWEAPGQMDAITALLPQPETNTP